MCKSIQLFFQTLTVSVVCLFTIYATCFLCFAEDAPRDAPAVTEEITETVEETSQPEEPINEEQSPQEEETPSQDETPLVEIEMPIEDETPPEDGEPSDNESSSSDVLEDVELSASSEENQAGGGGTESENDVKENGDNANSVDSSSDVPSLAEDVHAIRKYAEFFIFGVIPISCAIGLVIAGCIWFRKVFIRL